MASGDMMIIVVMMMMSSVFVVLAGGAFFLTRPEEGDECDPKNPDPLGYYVIDEDGKCVLDYCSTGYSVSSTGKACIQNTDPNKDSGGGGGGGGGGGECTEGLTVATHEGNLGACNTVYDVDPKEVKYQGTYFLPRNPVRGGEWIHELEVVGDTRSFIASHQSPDDWCKMVKFDITKKDGQCKYKVTDAGYTTSPTAASTCTTKQEVLSHWAAKNQQSLAPNNTTGGYGIEYMKYDKFC
jgi:hypothetical protein